MKKKNRKMFFPLKYKIKLYRKSIYIGVGLLIFPIIVGLFYKIPINLVNIDIGDLLSFYAVALGLFATYLTYIDNENKKSCERQDKLKPKIKLSFETDNDNNIKLRLSNLTDNDYTVNYIGCEDMGRIYETEERRYLNANNHLDFILEDLEELPVGLVQIGIIDTDRHEWAVVFEKQAESDVYCRISIDALT